MAVAPTYASNLPGKQAYHVIGDVKEVLATGTVGAADTYVTGGFTISPSSFGLSVFFNVDETVFSNGYWGFWNASTGKMQVFSAAGTELANASAALQNATFTFEAEGK